MTKRDWLEVGLKLLGVYFTVMGVVVVTVTITGFVYYEMNRQAAAVQNLLHDSGGFLSADSSIVLLNLVRPIAFIAAGYILTGCTEWCLSKLGHPASRPLLSGDDSN